MAQDGMDEELDEELELLRAMWSSEEELQIERPTCATCEISGDAAAARLIAQLAPNTGGEDHSQYLRCEIVVTVPSGYPGDLEYPVLPQVRLGASSGLSDTRRAALLAALEDLLRSDFAGLPGALPAVLEATQEWLTTWNDEGPTGQCPVCLVELGHGEGATELTNNFAATSLLRLPCYHILHAACFAQFWEAEWLRQSEDCQKNSLTVEENVALTIQEAVVACPECRQVASWEEVPQIHSSLEPLLVAASAKKTATAPQNDHADEGEVEKGATEDDKAGRYIPSPSPPPLQNGVALSFQQQKSATNRVDLFEVVMARGLRTRLKPKWDARDQEGPVLRSGACGVVAEFVEGKDATYLRPEGTDYWLPLNGGRNNCKMVRIDQDMPRPLKAPSGWIHGDNCLGVALTSPACVEGAASRKDRKKTKNNHGGGGYASGNKLLGA